MSDEEQFPTSSVLTVGPDGVIDLPLDVLTHLGIPEGGSVEVELGPDRTLYLRRS